MQYLLFLLMLLKMQDLLTLFFLIACTYFSFYTKKLTLPGAITGLLSAIIIYRATGYAGLSMLAAFFITGTMATLCGRQAKLVLQKSGDGTQRKASQVLANSGAATLISLMALLIPLNHSVLLLIAASFSSATADTLSSELGMVYGKRFYNCISLKKEKRGMDGAISIEGTLIGTAGAILIALIYSIFNVFNGDFLIIVFAGITGNYADSLFGVLLERKKLLNNDWVNFLSTVLAMLIAVLLSNGFF